MGTLIHYAMFIIHKLYVMILTYRDKLLDIENHEHLFY